MNDEQQNFWKQYDKEHRFCPSCGCVRIHQQLACRYGDKDDNGAFCQCGWKGIVHDLTKTRIPNACNCDRCVELIIKGDFER